MRHVLTAALVLGIAASFPVRAQVQPGPPRAPEVEPRVLDTTVVAGIVPGPGLWKVRHGGHTLWILGTQSPLPAKMEWEAAKVHAAIARSDAVLSPPSVVVGGDIGFFGKLALVPAVLKVRNNPDGASLRESVEPATYARWLPLRQRYFGNDRGIEKRRPLVAATELYERAIEESGLTGPKRVYDEIARAMKKRDLDWTRSAVEFKVPDIKGAVKELQRTRLDDGGCFERTLERLETDVGYMRLRANAWASGDVEALRRLQRPDQYEACRDALLKSALAGKYGIDSAEAKAQEKWLATADAALRSNRGTFAVLPMRELLSGDGLLAKLAARGFEVEAPGAPVRPAPAQ
jgi:hypothetical protein